MRGTNTISLTQSKSDLRAKFPILEREVNGFPLVYLDNAATTQKPKAVIDALDSYYEQNNSNVHRGVHTLANEATEAFEATRKTAAEFLGADQKEIVFTKGTTDSVNLLSHSWGEKNIQKDDLILIGEGEHHSNLVPWQLLAQRKGANILPIKLDETGVLDLKDLEKALEKGPKILAINFVSNSLGTVNKVEEIISLCHAKGCLVFLDCAQAAAHEKIEVKDLNADFLAFSGHKMYGPTGVGILYGKYELLEAMPPFIAGGEMIKEVSFEGTTYQDPPLRFEAGTPNIADFVAYKSAFDFVTDLSWDSIKTDEKEIIEYSRDRMKTIPGLIEYGSSERKIASFSFNIEGMHPFDVGQLLDARGIAVRTGHHCTMPLMEKLGVEGTVRASFSAYNTLEEAEKLWDRVSQVQKKYGSS